MKIPEKYQAIWNAAEPLLNQGRPGDREYSLEIVAFILEHVDESSYDILIPVAIMHDIGHSAILAEHFKYVTGQAKLPNAKLVHMLAGAKIAKDILDSIHYDPKKAAEIVDIISIHDADQLENTDIQKVYDSENKKIFHDVDCMDRFNSERLEKVKKSMPDKNKTKAMLQQGLDSFFFPKFKKMAEEKLKTLKI